MDLKSFHDDYFHSDYSDYSSDDNFFDEIDDELMNGAENEISDSDDLEYDPEESINPPSKSDLILQNFEKEYAKFFNANLLTPKAKYLITQFINQDKFKNISFEKKCQVIHVSRKTLFNYRHKDMSEESQKSRAKAKVRPPKLTEEEYNEFFERCSELRNLKLAVTSKWAAKEIEKITAESGKPWEPCYSTIANIFISNGWHRRKSQKRSPFSDPGNRDEKISKFKQDLLDMVSTYNLKPSNIHMMDETGLYSDDIPAYTWVDKDDAEAYVVSNGQQRRDTLVCTIRADGEGFAWFIRHRNMKTRSINGEKMIVDKGVKGMNIEEMKKWVEEFVKYAEEGDLLIMDNLSSHKNKDILYQLESHGIHVLFLPPRCADALSVLDNCFFAIFKKIWYKKLLFVNNVDDKEREAIRLFNDLIQRKIGKAMYIRCLYYDLLGISRDAVNNQRPIDDIIEEAQRDYE